MVIRLLLAVLLLAAVLVVLSLTGCAAPRVVVETQEVRVPVPYRVQPPEDLLQPFQPAAIPRFTAITDPAATSCLTPAGERALRELLIDLRLRIETWEAWAQ